MAWSIATTILLGIMALLALVVAATQFNEYSVVDDIINTTGDSSSGTLIDATTAGGRRSCSSIWVHMATGILFVIWQYRHSRNAQSLAGPGGLGPPWAIAGWFIPLAALVLPGVELYQSSQASSPPVPGGGPRSGKGSGLVIAWMVASALGSLGLSASFFVGTQEDGFGGMDPEGRAHPAAPRQSRRPGARGRRSAGRRHGPFAHEAADPADQRGVRRRHVRPLGAQPPAAWAPAQPAGAPWGPAPPPPPQDQSPWGAPPGSPPPPPPGGPAPGTRPRSEGVTRRARAGERSDGGVGLVGLVGDQGAAVELLAGGERELGDDP